MKKILIGITGAYCAGKNHVSSLFEKKGFPVLDLDKLGHQAIEAEKDLILKRFGNDILVDDMPVGDISATGSLIDRRKLGQKVFGKPAEMRALEEIVHPWVNKETNLWIKSREEEVCLINAALLHRSSAFEQFDLIIIVEAPFLIRLFRAKRRDKLPWLVLLKRLMSQKNFDTQYLRKKTDIYRVGNYSASMNSRAKLENQIDEILSFRELYKV